VKRRGSRIAKAKVPACSATNWAARQVSTSPGKKYIYGLIITVDEINRMQPNFSAQQEGLLCEESGQMDNIKYCGYCSYHFKKLVNF